MSYINAAVIPALEKNLDAYKKLATQMGKLWIEHGALAYYEAAGDDVPEGKSTDFFRAVKREQGETVVVAFIVFKSRQDRDVISQKVMSDPRAKMDPASMPFDAKRMFWGGFKTIVAL